MLAIKLTNPTMTFSSGTVHLYLGKREVVLFTLPGHTGGDVLAYVPDANVLFTGDMGWSKTLPNLVDATVNDWITSLDKILKDTQRRNSFPVTARWRRRQRCATSETISTTCAVASNKGSPMA